MPAELRGEDHPTQRLDLLDTHATRPWRQALVSEDLRAPLVVPGGVQQPLKLTLAAPGDPAQVMDADGFGAAKLAHIAPGLDGATAAHVSQQQSPARLQRSVFVQRPSDLGYSDEGYELPPIDIRWHELPTDHTEGAGVQKNGQSRMFRNAGLGIVEASREKRDSLAQRVEKLLALRDEDPAAHRVIWHDLEDERRALEAAIPGLTTVYGSQRDEEKETAIAAFRDGAVQEIACKPVMLGSGVNFQKYCHWAVFLGIGFKFNDFIQAIHRCYRFLQTKPVRVDLIYSEAERDIRKVLETKWQRHNEMVERMTEIVRQYGLSSAAMADTLKRSIGVSRAEASGQGWTLVNNDCVEELQQHEAESVGLIVTSVPFATQYEYTPSFNDFGHTDNDAHFWEQMDYLIPELFRVLEPGRVAAIHVKDRIVPGGLTGLGFQTVSPFSDDCTRAFRKHGFAFLSRITITTDVVRENNRTYRLGWTEQCKDGSKMGNGLPEYLLLFRRPPSDASDGYADRPVRKQKKLATDGAWQNADGYSRARWQLDAHGYWRSGGNRLLLPEEIQSLDPDVIYKLWKRHSLEALYDFEHHVRIGEALELKGRLPPTFMLLPPHSPHAEVWSDVTRMRTLNGAQHAAGKEMHLCPLQFDVVDRAIVRFSEPGEVVLDPFSGLGTVPLRAIELGRRGLGLELNPGYFADACHYLRGAEQKMGAPSLFDLLEPVESVA